MAQNQYRCGECGATFNSEEQRERHNRMAHSRYTCEACGQILGSENELEEHNRQMHPEMERPRTR